MKKEGKFVLNAIQKTGEKEGEIWNFLVKYLHDKYHNKCSFTFLSRVFVVYVNMIVAI